MLRVMSLRDFRLMFTGPVADQLGIQAWFFLGGLLCVLMGMAGLSIPAVINIEEKRDAMPDKLSTGPLRAV